MASRKKAGLQRLKQIRNDDSQEEKIWLQLIHIGVGENMLQHKEYYHGIYSDAAKNLNSGSKTSAKVY